MKKMMLPLLCVAFLTGADEKPKADKPPGEIKGTWEVGAVGHAGQIVPIEGGPTLIIGEKEAEWSAKVPFLFDAKGKGAVTIDAKKMPPTIELKVGDAVYKGIWRVNDTQDKKRESLEIVLSAAGGGFPTEFIKDFPPKTFKGFAISAERAKK